MRRITRLLEQPVFFMFTHIVYWILPRHRSDVVIGDIVVTDFDDRLPQLIESACRAIKSEIENRAFPPLFLREKMTVPARFALCKSVFGSTCRMDVTMMIGWYLVTLTGTEFVRDVNHIDFFGGIIPALVLMAFLPAYREGLIARPQKRMLPIHRLSLSAQLKSWLEALLTGPFSIEKAPVRSFLEALLLLSPAFFPLYAASRWFYGETLPRGLTWPSFWLRLVGVVMLFALWIVLKKVNRRAARFLDEEMRAIRLQEEKHFSHLGTGAK